MPLEHWRQWMRKRWQIGREEYDKRGNSKDFAHLPTSCTISSSFVILVSLNITRSSPNVSLTTKMYI